MQDITIPLIIRGRIIEDDLVRFESRRGELALWAPDVKKHMTELTLQDPADLADLYALSLDEIIAYFAELGLRLDYRQNAYMRAAMEAAVGASHHTAEMLAHSFGVMTKVFDPAFMMDYIENSIGRAYLDGWVEHKLLDRTIHVRAFGARSVHVIAGNGSVIALLTFLMNGVSRGDAIIKIPSNDPLLASAVARTMIDMAPDHPLTRHVSVAYWKGGDASVEKPLYQASKLEKIIAWGGFASMGSIREYLSPGLDLVALDPKLSASIIGQEAFQSEAGLQDAVNSAAADVGYFNQGGCVSARTLYVETGTDAAGLERANRFGKMLFDAIQALPSNLSSHHPAFDPVLRAEINGLRFSDAFRVFGGRASEGAVIVSQDDEGVDFADRLNCRVANVVPVDSIAAALRHLTIHTQTIGVYPDSLKARIRDECALRGGQRITRLGYATAGNFTGPHDAIEPLRRMVRWIKDESPEGRVGVLHG